MFRNLTDTAKAGLFFALAFGITVCVSLLYPLLGNATMVLHMYAPTFATLLMLLVVTRDGYSKAAWSSLGLHRAGLRWWSFALLGPLVVMSAVYGIVWITGVGSPVVPQGYTALTLLLELGASLVINTGFALGEEIGFRGYLLPRLLPLGTTRALLLSGLMHASWHFPLMLLTPVYPVLGNWLIIGPVILLTLTVAGVFYGYLQLNSKSMWPATLGHGAVNAYFKMFGLITITSTPLALEYLAGERGVLTLIGTALGAAWLISRMRRQRSRVAVQAVSGA